MIELDSYLKREKVGGKICAIKKTLKELNHEDICNQVRCPNCKSWFYF
jgi:lipoate synthase